ncbi:MAG TPA: hypothetical protein VK626_01765 [Nitrospiraceae bacterium]|nr:hypothetical protein [Nitrospiraceae bacterium]
MSYGVRLCHFTSLDDIPVKDRAKSDVLLAYFRQSGTRQVSTFEMTQPIWNTLKLLEKDGHLTLIDSAYPWIKFTMPSEQHAAGQKP